MTASDLMSNILTTKIMSLSKVTNMSLKCLLFEVLSYT